MQTRSKLGPGRYNPIPSRIGSAGLNTGAVAFKQKAKRLIYKHNKNPAPGHYDIPRSFNPNAEKPRPSSCFAPKVSEKRANLLEKEDIRLNDIRTKLVKAKQRASNRKFEIPGPGYYENALSHNMLLDHKPLTIEGTRSFQNRVSRFKNYYKEEGGKPGPGYYQTKKTFDRRRYLVNDAVFMSESERITFNNKLAIEGLGHFDPVMKARKTDFINNKHRKFLV